MALKSILWTYKFQLGFFSLKSRQYSVRNPYFKALDENYSSNFVCFERHKLDAMLQFLLLPPSPKKSKILVEIRCSFEIFHRQIDKYNLKKYTKLKNLYQKMWLDQLIRRIRMYSEEKKCHSFSFFVIHFLHQNKSYVCRTNLFTNLSKISLVLYISTSSNNVEFILILVELKF